MLVVSSSQLCYHQLCHILFSHIGCSARCGNWKDGVFFIHIGMILFVILKDRRNELLVVSTESYPDKKKRGEKRWKWKNPFSPHIVSIYNQSESNSNDSFKEAIHSTCPRQQDEEKPIDDLLRHTHCVSD